MSDLSIDRREMLSAGAVLAAGAAVLAPAGVSAQGAAATLAHPPYAPMPLPLPFDAKTVPGLSEKLLISHHDNNFVAAVNRLASSTAHIAALDPATAPGFLLNGLKREELVAWNSMVIHEIYLSQFGTPNAPGHGLAAAIERDFGSDARWRAEFSGMGKTLGGGSGWVLPTWSHRDKRLVIQWAADHTMVLAGGTTILALDMYEHAYAMDYGAKAAAYVDVYMAAVNWSAADVRFTRASAA